jgi:hypothetical protein
MMVIVGASTARAATPADMSAWRGGFQDHLGGLSASRENASVTVYEGMM